MLQGVMKYRVKKIIEIYLCAVLIGIAAVNVISVVGFGIPCLFYLVTGLKCPGCGNTTAVMALLHMDFKGAFEANMLFPLEFAYLLWVIIYSTVKYIRKGEGDLFPDYKAVNIPVLAVVVIWSVVRNIPAFTLGFGQ